MLMLVSQIASDIRAFQASQDTCSKDAVGSGLLHSDPPILSIWITGHRAGRLATILDRRLA